MRRIMSTSQNTIRWALEEIVEVSLSLLVYGIVGGLTAAPAFLLISQYYPAAEPMLFVALIGIIIAILGHSRDAEDPDFMEDADDLSSIQRKQYFISILFIMSLVVSTQLGVVAVVSALLAQTTGVALLAIAVAFVSPTADGYLARKTNISIGRFAGFVGYYILMTISILSGISQDTATTAAEDAKSVF